MKPGPKYIQINLPETDKLNLDQAEAVLKYKPDIILLEYPNNEKTPDTIYNNYSTKDKPLEKIKEQEESLQKQLVSQPWAQADITMWKNIAKLWQEGHECLVYRTDAPSELANEWFLVWKNMYPCATKNWLWWVKIYLREKYMAENIKWILANYKTKADPTVLVFLQSFHWRHVKFLLKDPPPEKEWQYYFGKFDKITPGLVKETIQKLNSVFYKYWLEQRGEN